MAAVEASDLACGVARGDAVRLSVAVVGVVAADDSDLSYVAVILLGRPWGLVDRRVACAGAAVAFAVVVAEESDVAFGADGAAGRQDVAASELLVEVRELDFGAYFEAAWGNDASCCLGDFQVASFAVVVAGVVVVVAWASAAPVVGRAVGARVAPGSSCCIPLCSFNALLVRLFLVFGIQTVDR